MHSSRHTFLLILLVASLALVSCKSSSPKGKESQNKAQVSVDIVPDVDSMDAEESERIEDEETIEEDFRCPDETTTKKPALIELSLELEPEESPVASTTEVPKTDECCDENEAPEEVEQVVVVANKNSKASKNKDVAYELVEGEKADPPSNVESKKEATKVSEKAASNTITKHNKSNKSSEKQNKRNKREASGKKNGKATKGKKNGRKLSSPKNAKGTKSSGKKSKKNSRKN